MGRLFSPQEYQRLDAALHAQCLEPDRIVEVLDLVGGKFANQPWSYKSDHFLTTYAQEINMHYGRRLLENGGEHVGGGSHGHEIDLLELSLPEFFLLRDDNTRKSGDIVSRLGLALERGKERFFNNYTRQRYAVLKDRQEEFFGRMRSYNWRGHGMEFDNDYVVAHVRTVVFDSKTLEPLHTAKLSQGRVADITSYRRAS